MKTPDSSRQFESSEKVTRSKQAKPREIRGWVSPKLQRTAAERQTRVSPLTHLLNPLYSHSAVGPRLKEVSYLWLDLSGFRSI